MTARIGFLGYPIQLQLQEIKDSFEHEKRKNHRVHSHYKNGLVTKHDKGPILSGWTEL